MSRVRSALSKRWVRVGLLVAIGLVVVALGLFGAARSARRSLADGREGLDRARELLAGGETAEATLAFTRARASFSSAVGEANGPWFRIAGVVPVLGRTPDAIRAIAESGVRVSEAGATLAEAIDDVGGIAALAPSRGRIPIEPLLELTPSVAAAEQQIADVVAGLEEAPRTLLVGPVAAARRDAEEEARSLLDVLSTASSLLDGLPSFLGSEGPRRYFFGAQNPAELRGTGGVVGAYSILTLDDGFLDFSPFRPIQSLPLLSIDEVPSPSTEYSDNYDQFRGDGRFWLAINLTPDFPTAARAIIEAYAVAKGERLDGVLLSDPFALEALMRLTGPAPVPGLDVTLTADTVVAFTANEAFSLLPDPEARKRLLGAVAQGIVSRFLESGDLDAGDVRSLARVAGEGHLLVYSDDPTVQSALEGTGAGGALRAGDHEDLLAVVENSSGGSKVDYYEDRSVRYEVWLRPDGSAEATATVTLANHAPTSGEPRYVIGPYEGFSQAGESAQIVGMFCGTGCRLVGAERNGARIGVGAGTELGYPFFRDDFRTPSGGTSELRLTWYLPDAWIGGSIGGTYRLAVLDQPTIRPDTTTIVVHLPEGMRASETIPAMNVDEGSATWEGTLEGRFEMMIRFEPPPLVRLWRLLTPG